MKVFSLTDDFDINNCSVENEFGWFWCLDDRYIPSRNPGGCKRVYRIFRVKLKKDSSEMFVAYKESEPLMDSNSLEDLYIKISLYDFKRRCQG